jgi:hypothetical protein
MQFDTNSQQRQPGVDPHFISPSAQPPLLGSLPPAPDILLIEATDEAAAKAHFKALLDGTALTPVRRAVPGVFLVTAQESGHWWRFRAYITVS